MFGDDYPRPVARKLARLQVKLREGPCVCERGFVFSLFLCLAAAIFAGRLRTRRRRIMLEVAGRVPKCVPIQTLGVFSELAELPNLLNLLARPNGFEPLTPRFVVSFPAHFQPIERTRFRP